MSQLFSKKNKEVLFTPLGLNNPVTVQVLGICSALAVTAQLEPAIVMGLSVTVITAFANVGLSVVKNGRVANPDYEVDGISGGTITSQGVDAMLKDCLKPYEKFLNK